MKVKLVAFEMGDGVFTANGGIVPQFCNEFQSILSVWLSFGTNEEIALLTVTIRFCLDTAGINTANVQ